MKENVQFYEGCVEKARMKLEAVRTYIINQLCGCSISIITSAKLQLAADILSDAEKEHEYYTKRLDEEVAAGMPSEPAGEVHDE